MDICQGQQVSEGFPCFVDLCRFFAGRAMQATLGVESVSRVVKYVNPAFCELVGKLESQLVGLQLSVVLPERDHSECIKLFERVARTGKAESLVEEETIENRPSFWSYFFWAVGGEHQQSTGVIVQITDISKSIFDQQRCTEINQTLILNSLRQQEIAESAEKLNSELMSVSQAKNQFLAAMSHEIRTPLNAIMGFSELLARPAQSDFVRRDYGARIKRHSKLLLRLIDDILDLSKVEAGRLEIEKIEVNLSELLLDTRMAMSQLAEEKGLIFSMIIPDELPFTILCDPTRLKQVLTNIIGNAIKFTERGTVEVTISIDPQEKQMHFIVKDSGIGMLPDQMAKIFQPFTQGDATTSRKFGGTGLGLDLSRRLAQALGGNIVLLESQPGIGSIFEITIAIEQGSGQVVSSPRSRSGDNLAHSLDGFFVLVADDAPDNRFLVTQYLMLAGASVEVAEDGEEAVNKALNKNYDIILMDIQMPRLDGYKAISILRELGEKIPILALTAHAMRSEIDKCFEAGCDAHLAKPFEMYDLVNAVLKLAKAKPQWRETEENPNLH